MGKKEKKKKKFLNFEQRSLGSARESRVGWGFVLRCSSDDSIRLTADDHIIER